MYRRGLIWDEWFGWIIAALVLVVSLLAYGLLSDRGNAALEALSNLLRFGR